jgi:ABC-type transporter Mla subunit MlaD
MRGTYLRVGLLVITGIALLVGAVMFLGGNQIRHGRPYETYFRDSVQGLDVGAPVKYRGVTIGAVTEIGLTSAVYGRNQPDEIRRSTFRTVLVRFEIEGSGPGSRRRG